MSAQALRTLAPVVTLSNNRVVTTSKDVADCFSKHHRDVLRAIENLLADLPEDHQRNFAQTVIERPNPSGGAPIKSPAYEITRDGFTLLAMGFTGKKALQFKLAYIDAFNQMESKLRELAPGAADRILNSTIGTDGFRVLGALVAGKVRALPPATRRRATMKLWAQVHAAFNVRSAEDIPVNQLDSARNFVAAYVLEGELLDREHLPMGRHVPMATIYNAYALVRHFDALADIFKERRMYEHLSGLGSDLGGLMIDRFKDGRIFSHRLKHAFAPEIAEFSRRIEEGKPAYDLH